MAERDAIRWDERYADVPIAAPTPPDALQAAGLTASAAEMTTALDVACGSGGQSAWLALQGVTVTAIDVSHVAVRLTNEAAAANDVAERVHAHVVDLDRGLPTDLTGYDLIVCQRFRDQQLYPEFAARLVLGGLAVVTVLSETGTDEPGPFHAPTGELATAFDRSDLETLFHAEADGNESIVVRRIR